MKYIKFFLVLGLISHLTYAGDEERSNFRSTVLNLNFRSADEHLGFLDAVVSYGKGKTILNLESQEELNKLCEEVAGMLFFANPLTIYDGHSKFAGLEGIDKAGQGYGFRDSNGSTEDEHMIIREVTLAGFLGQHYREIFTKKGASAQ